MRDRMDLTTVAQVKALLHPLRQKMMDVLQKGPATPSEVGRAVGVAANKAHYHVHVLEAAGLVELVETRQVGSITEKYYAAVAREISGMLSPDGEVKRSDLLPLLEAEVHALMSDLSWHTKQNHSGAMACLSLTEALSDKWPEVEHLIERLKTSFDKAVVESPGQHLRVMIAMVPIHDEDKEGSA